MEKAYQKTDPLFIKIDNHIWALPSGSSSSADANDKETFPHSSMDSTSSVATHSDLVMNTATTLPSKVYDQSQVLESQEETLAASGPSGQLNTDTVPKVDSFLNYSMQRVSHVRRVDLDSIMYHQHVIPTNESIACIQPKNITLFYPSSSEKRGTIAPITITTVDNVPSKTLIVQENLDQSQTDQQQQNREAGVSRELLEAACSSIYGNKSSSKDRPLPLKKNRTKKLVLFDVSKCRQDKEHSEPNASASVPVETSARKKNQSCVKSTSSMEGSDIESACTTVKKKKKRTVTSYDSETSLYLKSVFFEVYSCQKKLTKLQRIQVQKKTGLPSRNITYWFSNHKRRLHQTLVVYRKTVEDSKGAIKNYMDFLDWRRARGLPDQISQAEVQQLEDEEPPCRKPKM